MDQGGDELDGRVFDTGEFFFDEFVVGDRFEKIEQDHQFLVLGLLELLDDQFIASGGGSPMDPAFGVSWAVGSEPEEISFVAQRTDLALAIARVPFAKQFAPIGCKFTDGWLDGQILW